MSSDETIKIRHWLAPLAFLYGLGVRFRNQLFTRGVLPSEQYDVPVICVGNLAAGGTGKTPHTEYLIRLLRQQYRIAVLSRGYKRETTGFILANTESSCREIGDEPFQIKQKFPDILVAVDADRREGIRRLLELPDKEKPEVILLDDGFQHRYVTPSLSIVLTDYNRLFYFDKLLPAGLLREPVDEIKRADIVIVTKCKKDMKPIEFRIIEDHADLLANQELFFTQVTYGELLPVFPSIALPRVKRDIRRDDEVLVVSGIALPEPFIQEVSKYSTQVRTLIFPDHHAFTEKDVERINKEFESLQSEEKLIIVTEKDAARLQDNPLVPEHWKERLYALPISICFHNKRENDFHKLIHQNIKNVQNKTI